jgi:NADP-dependent 3-hydroxy acid dehydrogenase YdfG
MTAGTVAVVTGAASGIGAAVARELAAPGVRLVLGTLPGEALRDVLAAVTAAGAEGVIVEADVRDAEQAASLSAEAESRFGRIDLLVACAGIADRGSVADGDPERWRAVVETNLLGAAYCVRGALPAMQRQGSGHVVLIASVSGRDTYVGEPLYIASKWGLVGFGHALRQEVGSSGVRVTLIEPGLVDTPLTRGSAVVRPLLEASAPLSAEDVARAVAYAYAQPSNVAISELVVRAFPDPDLDLLQGRAE